MSPWSVHGSDGDPTQSRSHRTRFTVTVNGETKTAPPPRSTRMRTCARAESHGGFAVGEQGLMKGGPKLTPFTQISPAGHSASPTDGIPHAWVVVLEQNPCCEMKNAAPAPRALGGNPRAITRSAALAESAQRALRMP